jgi:hypothetical protein
MEPPGRLRGRARRRKLRVMVQDQHEGAPLSSRPLQNRVTPWGDIEAVPARGLMMGNRGGRIHRDDRTLGGRRWASKQWIICVTEFRGRHRQVMGPGYTELFFLDDAAAMAAGHRPCFECRRADALGFAEGWAADAGLPARPKAPWMDVCLHAQRRGPRARALARDLPDGAMFASGGAAMLRVDGGARVWGWGGYGPAVPLPPAEVEVLTPEGALCALRGGWRPVLHPSAAGAPSRS